MSYYENYTKLNYTNDGGALVYQLELGEAVFNRISEIRPLYIVVKFLLVCQYKMYRNYI